MVVRLNNSDITKRQPNETTLQYYARLKKATDNGLIELSIQDMYQLIYGEYKGYDYSQRCLKFLKDTLELDESGMVANENEVGNDTDVPVKASIEINKDGSQCSSKIVQMSEEQSKDVNFLLEAHGYDKSSWKIRDAKSSIWQVNCKGAITKDLYSSKITVKPKQAEWSIEDIDKYFENKDFKSIQEQYAPTNYEPDGEVLEICLPDIHMGLLTHHLETQENYDIKIAKQRFNQCMSDILERIQGRKFSKIYLVPLGDLFHVDNASYSTNKSTLQDCDGRFTKMFNNTLDMMIDSIEMLSKRSQSLIHIPFISGNHSRVMEYTLIKSIEVAFRNDSSIVVDAAPSPSKFEQFGNVLIGWTHGDCSIQNMSEWLQSHARREFGKSRYVEVHSGHTHTTQTIEKSGMIIRHLPTICSSSSWENQQLYGKNIKTVVSFVWNPNNGLREMWLSNL